VTDGIRRLMAARAGTAHTIPLTTIGCTTAIGPACSALACSAKAQVARNWPSSHSGRRTRYPSRATTLCADSGAFSAAWCCTEVEIANVAALSRASVTASTVTHSL
jgi:hypothetical protein